MQGLVAAANATGGQVAMDYSAIPNCIYTDPEIAHVGLYEKEAEAKGLRVKTIEVPFSEVDRAILDGEEEGFLRVHLKKGTDRILGATMVSRHAGETISEISLAMTSGAGMTGLSRTIHPYPTQAEVIKKAADAYNRTRLSPLVKTILRRWIAWRR